LGSASIDNNSIAGAMENFRLHTLIEKRKPIWALQKQPLEVKARLCFLESSLEITEIAGYGGKSISNPRSNGNWLPIRKRNRHVSPVNQSP
jgi:hypothetical protein